MASAGYGPVGVSQDYAPLFASFFSLSSSASPPLASTAIHRQMKRVAFCHNIFISAA